MKLLNTILLLLSFTTLHAQTGINLKEFERVDSVIKYHMEKWNIHGGSVAIAKDGKLIYNKGFGFADQRWEEEAEPYHLYRIASVSKIVTTIAVMKLIESGKLSLTDSVFGNNKILRQPYYLDAIADTRVYGITIQHLLEHTSGWNSLLPCDGFTFCDPAYFPTHTTETEQESNPVGDSTMVKFIL